MDVTIYTLVPIFSTGMLAFILLFKLYKRSVSATLTILIMAIVMNLAKEGYLDYAGLVAMTGTLAIACRGMMKPETDSWFVSGCAGCKNYEKD